jgi:small subunit ribosomal protein S2
MEITTDELLKNAVHFGHRTYKWNPKMKPFIAGAAKGIHIFDVELIKQYLENALNFITKASQEGKQFMLIGTKFQVSDMIAQMGKDLSIPYMNHKWIAGTLTNFDTIKKRIKYLKTLEEMENTGEIEKYTKKEQSKLRKEKEDLLYSLGGIKNMDRLPDVVIIVDVYKERIAMKEAQKLGMNIVALVDTNGDPDGITYPIPCNDDAMKSLTYILTKIKEAYSLGRHVAPQRSVTTEPENTSAS